MGVDFISILEVFCAASHGTVRGYRHRGDRVEAIFDEGNELVEKWGLDVLQNAIVTVAKQSVLPYGDTRYRVDKAGVSLWIISVLFIRRKSKR